jgi:hypothetical protein
MHHFWSKNVVEINIFFTVFVIKFKSFQTEINSKIPGKCSFVVKISIFGKPHRYVIDFNFIIELYLHLIP